MTPSPRHPEALAAQSPMRVAALVGAGRDDAPFRSAQADDGRTALYLELQRGLQEHGIALHTLDQITAAQQTPAFEIHVNARQRVRWAQRPCAALLLETPQIRPLNEDRSVLSRYDLLFSWRSDTPETTRQCRIAAYPVPLTAMQADGWRDRPHFACLIASNKSMRDTSAQNLYLKRLKTIRWFEQHQPQALDLYGPGWDIPATAKTSLGAVQRALYRWNHSADQKPPYPSWQGTLASKNTLMRRYRFAFCYENVADLPGYITEKIFDAMGAGCLPIYWGAPDVGRFVPEDCFIDRRRFPQHAALWAFLQQMSETEFVRRQQAMHAFMTSDAAQRFSARHFGTQVSDRLAQCFLPATPPP